MFSKNEGIMIYNRETFFSIFRSFLSPLVFISQNEVPKTSKRNSNEANMPKLGPNGDQKHQFC